MAPGGKFPENSLAKFDVIVIDGDGKRREDTGLKYQIYEEGRSFAWYQAEGRWDYKQLQQRRRIGGGSLDIKATGANIIRWPVTAGTYSLEITDANGVVLARLHFNAGWGLVKSDPAASGDLALTADVQTVAQPGAAAHIKFKLDHPAVIDAVIADDQIRKVIHEVRAAGENQIALTPDENWGNRVRIRVEAEQKTGDGTNSIAGQMELPVRHQKKELLIATEPVARINSGQDLPLNILVSNIDRRQQTFISVLATPLAKDGSTMLPAVLLRDVTVSADGKAPVRLAIPAFSGNLHLVITAVNQNQHGQKELMLPIETGFTADLPMPPLLDVGRYRLHLALTLQNNNAPANFYHYALSGSAGLKITGAMEGKINFPAKAA